MTDVPIEKHTCKSCGNEFTGHYCNLCGEKIIEARDRKFNKVLGNVLIATTVVDNKFVKSLWLTIRNPGFLSLEYVNGRRVMYMRPLQMFFILNLVYFLFPVLQLFNSSLRTQLHVLPHQKIARAVVTEKLRNEGLTLPGYELMYNEKTTSLAKLLIVVFVILASLPLSLIFRKKNRYFTDHVALAVELTSFNLAVNAIGLTLLFTFINTVFHWGNWGWGNYLNDVTLTIVFVLSNMYFLLRSAKTFYSQKGKRIVVKAALGILGLFLALEVFRFLLFFITVWAL